MYCFSRVASRFEGHKRVIPVHRAARTAPDEAGRARHQPHPVSPLVLAMIGAMCLRARKHEPMDDRQKASGWPQAWGEICPCSSTCAAVPKHAGLIRSQGRVGKHHSSDAGQSSEQPDLSRWQVMLITHRWTRSWPSPALCTCVHLADGGRRLHCATVAAPVICWTPRCVDADPSSGLFLQKPRS